MAPEPEQWLIWEWPERAERPEHYWLSTLPQDTALELLAYLAKLRWGVERDYQEMKSEVGLDHYEPWLLPRACDDERPAQAGRGVRLDRRR